MNTTTRKSCTSVRLVADLNPAGPAKVQRKRKHDPAVLHAKMERFDVTREPDALDEVTGEAIWFGDTFAVVVRIEHLNAFRTFISCEGLNPGERFYAIEALTTAEVTWAELRNAVKPLRKIA